MGWSGRAPAPPASEAGKGRQRQGARHVSDTQYRDRRDRHSAFRRPDPLDPRHGVLEIRCWVSLIVAGFRAGKGAGRGAYYGGWRQLSDAIAAPSTNALKQSSW
jgi:hypothetical protein